MVEGGMDESGDGVVQAMGSDSGDGGGVSVALQHRQLLELWDEEREEKGVE